MTDLKKQLIKLGSTNPELRSHIRPVLDSLSDKTAAKASKDVTNKMRLANKYPSFMFKGLKNSRGDFQDNHNKLYWTEDTPYTSVFANTAKVVSALVEEIKKVRGLKKVSVSGDTINVLLPSGTEWAITITSDRGFMSAYFRPRVDKRVGDRKEHFLTLYYPDDKVDLSKYTPVRFETIKGHSAPVYEHDLVPASVKDMAKDFSEILKLDKAEARSTLKFEKELPDRVRIPQLMLEFTEKLNLDGVRSRIDQGENPMVILSTPNDGKFFVSFVLRGPNSGRGWDDGTSFQIFFLKEVWGRSDWRSVPYHPKAYKKGEMGQAVRDFEEEISQFLNIEEKNRIYREKKIVEEQKALERDKTLGKDFAKNLKLAEKLLSSVNGSMSPKQFWKVSSNFQTVSWGNGPGVGNTLLSLVITMLDRNIPGAQEADKALKQLNTRAKGILASAVEGVVLNTARKAGLQNPMFEVNYNAVETKGEGRFKALLFCEGATPRDYSRHAAYGLALGKKDVSGDTANALKKFVAAFGGLTDVTTKIPMHPMVGITIYYPLLSGEIYRGTIKTDS